MAAASAPPRPILRQRLVPRFSLAAALAALTLCAVGLWYWFRVPFEVEHEVVRYGFADDPFASGAIDGKLLAHVHRLWGGETVRHGLVTMFDLKGSKRAEENFREGILHGEYRRWDADGHLRVEGWYDSGRPAGEWIWHSEFRKWDSPTPALSADPFGGPPSVTFPVYAYGKVISHWEDGLPDGSWEWRDPAGKIYLQLEFENGRLVSGQTELLDECSRKLLEGQAFETTREAVLVLRPVSGDFRSTPLKDVCQMLRDATEAPLELDWRPLEENGINIDAPVTARVENLPLAAALKPILATNNLATDYRFGTIWITPGKVGGNWRDSTAISQISPPAGSKLSGAWNAPATMQFIETPLESALQSLEKQYPIQFDLSRLSPKETQVPVTVNITGLSLKNSLGILFDRYLMRGELQEGKLVVELRHSERSSQ